MGTVYSERFWDKVAIGEPHECWEWQAGKDAQRYGRINIDKHNLKAHRVAWLLTFGTIPNGLCCCHHCDNPGCCNPYHLFLGTIADNNADCVGKNRRGHHTKNRGSNNGHSTLMESDVLKIRALLQGGTMQTVIACLYDVNISAISNIYTGRTWAWLKEADILETNA